MYALRESGFKNAEHARVVWTVYPESGTPWEAVLKPEYWAHVARKLSPTDEIIVLPEELHYRAHLMVAHVMPNSVSVRVISKVDFGDQQPDKIDMDDLEVCWSGPVKKHRVIRKSDGMVLAEGEAVATKAQALQFVADYRKAMAA